MLGKDDSAIEAQRANWPTAWTSPWSCKVALMSAPPNVMDIPVFMGNIKSARGHLGAFEVNVENFRPTVPSSKSQVGVHRHW